jgi:hypothetical protein
VNYLPEKIIHYPFIIYQFNQRFCDSLQLGVKCINHREGQEVGTEEKEFNFVVNKTLKNSEKKLLSLRGYILS